MSLVEADDVPEARSFCSARKMLSPRPEGPHTGNLYDPSDLTSSVHGGWQDRLVSGTKADTALRLAGLGALGLGAYFLVSSLLAGRGHHASAGYGR